MLRLLGALIPVFYILFVTNVQGGEPRLQKSPISDLLSQTIVSAIYRDRKGILWIGTQGGLHRFDGASMTLYNSAGVKDNWIPANDIRGITEDKNGNFLIATIDAGLFQWNNQLQKFEAIAIHDGEETKNLLHISPSSSGGVWLGTRDEVFLYDSSTATKSRRGSKLTPIEIIGKPFTFIEDDFSNLFIGTTYGLEKLSAETDSVEQISLKSSITPKNAAVTAIDKEPNGNLIIGTNTGHLIILDKNSLAVLAEIKVGGKIKNYISDFAVYKNRIYVATDKGLFSADFDLSSVKELTETGTGLSNVDVFRILGDEELIWIGTFGGLDILFFPHFELFNEKNSAVPNDVLSLNQDSQGQLWIGTYHGLYFFNEKAKSHKKYQLPSSAESSSEQRVTSIARKKNELWLGLYQGGVKVLDVFSGKIRTPNLPDISELAVTKILADPNSNDLWIATYDHGLLQISDDSDSSYLKNNLLPNKRITQVFITKNGSLLVVSNNIIYESTLPDNQLSVLQFDFQLDKKIPDILTINQNKRGDILFGTDYHGLYMWTHAAQSIGNTRIEAVGKDAGLENSSIFGIEIDSSGNIWCSTQNGLVKLDSKGRFLDRFSPLDGLQHSDFTLGSSFTSAEGSMYFGGHRGYNRFNPIEIEVDRSPSPMLLTGIDFQRWSEYQIVDVSDFTNIQLTHQDRYVTFEFSVLDFFDPDRNQYRYKLEGFDSQWIENGNNNTATYTNLPPGDFVLRVQGANSAGIWNREGISLNVKVLPPPWKTWWAYCLYGLILFGLSWSGHRTYRSYAIDRKALQLATQMHEAQERADDDMQEQLEIQDSIITSAYQHNLGTLSLVSDFVGSETDEQPDHSGDTQTEGSIKRIAALACLEDCLFYHAGGPAADLNKYTEIVLSQLLASSPVDPETIITVNEVPTTLVPAAIASPMSIVIYEVLENCIQHAFDESSPANYIQIALDSRRNEHYTGDLWQLTIKDDGIGMPAGESPPERDSSGLAIVHKLIARLGGTISISSEDGTRVEVTLPYNTNTASPEASRQTI